MKYIITYKARQKNARRHVVKLCKGKTQYFDSIEEARNHPMIKHNTNYDTEILTANYRKVVTKL